MDKAIEMGKTSTYNSVQVFLGTSGSTIIRAIGAIVIGLLILPADMGLYTVALIPQSTLAIFQDPGIGSALGRYCAKFKAANDEVEQRRIIISGMLFETVLGLILTVIALLLSNFFAVTMYHRPESVLLIAITSVTILSGAVANGVVCVFVGLEQMRLNSWLLVISAIIYSTLAPFLVFLGYGALGAVIGVTISSVIQGVCAVVFLELFALKKLPRWKISGLEIRQTLKTMLSYGFPLGVSGLIGNLGGPFFSFLMAAYISDVVIGNYKIAVNFMILISFVTTPIANVLFPAFSKLDPEKEKNLLKTVFASSVKYTNIFLVPVTMALMVLANPLIGTIYGNKWPSAALFFVINMVFYLFSLIGMRSMGTVLTAMGETKFMLKMSVLSLVLSISLAFLLVPSMGIIGMILGISISGLPGSIIGLYVIWKKYGVRADFGGSGRILFASTISSVVAYLFVHFFAVAYWVSLTGGVALFVVSYLVFSPLVGAINKTDVENLRTMFLASAIFSKLIEVPLKIIEKVLGRLTNSDHNENAIKSN